MYAQVAVASPLASELTYAIPSLLQDQVVVGSAVLVPFGRRKESGWVTELVDATELPPDKIRPIVRLLDPEPVFDAVQLAFFRWIADYYLQPLGMVVSTATPSQMRARTLRVAQPTEAGVEALTEKLARGNQALVLREIVASPGLTSRSLGKRLEPELEPASTRRAVDALVRRGWVEWGEKELGGSQATLQVARLLVPAGELRSRVPRAGTRMVALVQALDRAGGSAEVRELEAEQGSSTRSSLGRLVSAGAVALEERQRHLDLQDVPALGPSAPLALNDDQAAALAALTAPDAAGTYLLYGVTASGKTEVFLEVARAVLARGRQVLVLVPEIGLTPQLVGRFKARFGDGVAVLHSGLTGAERLSEWRRIRAGEADVAVGARSALFAPFPDLGLLVVDEEHDDSYKQDVGVPYSARDLAVVRGLRGGCPVVLASATPSLESWQNARRGRYHLLRLPKRATSRPVPQIEVVDLTALDRDDDRPAPVFAPEVLEALSQTFDQDGQAIVMYNRRGYAPMVQCTRCHNTYECPNCGITLTLHRRAHVVACHYCGLTRPYSGRCPHCGGGMEELGKGTERVEEALHEAFPDVPTDRMDADTTASRGSHQRILTRFREGRSRLLVGTQMLAKGHDFPRVHTAVVVSADHGLRIPDFRSAERTWSLLVQLAGRAGRGEVAGRVFLQTWDPKHYVIRRLGDADGFMAQELHLRDVLSYPPFTRLCLVRLQGPDRERVLEASRDLASDLRAVAEEHPGVSALGPAPAALPWLVGRWRFQVVLRGRDVRAFRAFLGASHDRLRRASRKGVRVSWDVDPRQLL